MVVVLHGVSWEELAAADVAPLQVLLRRAAVGVMNSRPLEAPDSFAAYVSIGAGRAAVVRGQFPVAHGTAHAPGGKELSPSALQRGMADLHEANRRAHSQAEPGLLGGVLRDHRLRTGLLLVSDGRYFPGPAAAIAADRGGEVDWIGSASPGGGDRGLLAQAWHDADLLVIDLAALHPGAPDEVIRGRQRHASPATPDPEALRILSDLEPTFTGIAHLVDPERDLLMIVSPTCPPYGSPKQMSFAPVAIIGPGFAPGLLTSQGTRRPGMVASVDLAPTMLRFFGISPAAEAARLGVAPMSGHAISVRPGGRALDQVLGISRRGARLLDLRWRFGGLYVVAEFIILALVGGWLVLAPEAARRARWRLRLVLLLGMSLPLALLFLPALEAGGVVQPYVMVAALAAAFTWLAWYGSPPLVGLGALLTATAAVIALDAMTGARLAGNSVISYNPMFGGRFYGVGNDLMGVATACAAVGSAALVQAAGGHRGRWALGPWLMVVMLAVGAPMWGANWGGGITAAFAFTAAYAAIRAGHPRLRHWLAGAVAAAAMGALLAGLDLARDARTWTHIGDSARVASSGGVGAALEMAARTIAANLGIIAQAPYSAATLLAMAGTLWLVMKPPAGLRTALEANRVLWGGLAGAAAGAVAAVALNDSGIVAAATATGITAAAVVYIALEGNRAPQ
ncbi:MAG TPA: hypothetical protein VM221_06360 [Armatimonadota bacterium]|nr:hypothetical protein [Armatimonadota bacterium]